MHMHSRGDKHRQQSNRENSSSSIPSIWHRGGESSMFCSQGYSPSEDCLLRKVAQETEGKCQADFFFSSCVDTCHCGRCMKNCFLHRSQECSTLMMKHTCAWSYFAIQNMGHFHHHVKRKEAFCNMSDEFRQPPNCAVPTLLQCQTV